MNYPPPSDRLSRRSVLIRAAWLGAAALLGGPVTAWAKPVDQHRLRFYHTHTGERLRLDFQLQSCSTATINKINRFLRDHRTGESYPIDLQLLEMLGVVQKRLGHQGTFEVISGYRSPKTNSMLRRQSSGVARKSLHMQGRAIDVRLRGVPTRELRDIARKAQFGGVGYYADSDFVHLDTGRVRFW